VPGQLVVHFQPDVTDQQRNAILGSSGATLDRDLLAPGYALVSVVPGQESAVGERLAASTAVTTAETNIVRLPASAPNDPYYGLQWNMGSIGLSAAREISDGSGVTVAVVDTGVAYENYHNPCDGNDYALAPDLAATIFVPGYNAFDTGPDCHPNDDYGHGTHVTGTIAENTDNGYGTAGIAPGASIMPIKVCGNDPKTHKYDCPEANIADGITWAVDHGADVINLSLSGEQQSDVETEAVSHAKDAGVVVVAAAGNGGADGIGDNHLQFPAAIEGVISVGAVGVLGIRATYSNYGVGASGQKMDLVAPGGDPISEGSNSVIWQQTYMSCTAATDFTVFPAATGCYGTSMAAAHVTAVVALIESKYPDVNRTQVRTILTCSAEDLGDPGPDLQYGAGLVRADNALADTDHDGIPDCIDSSVATLTPTFTPPPNNCVSPSLTPAPTPSPSPTPTDTPLPTDTPALTDTPTPTEPLVPTDTATSTETAMPSDTGTPTETSTPGDTATPTDTPVPTDTPTPTATPTPTPLIPHCGDVDCNGLVDPLDALGVMRWVANSVPVANCIGLGYVNCDAQLTAADATTLLKHSAGLPLNLPAGCSTLG